jgi:hypothetical protein
MGILDASLQTPDQEMDPRAQGILKAAFALMSASGATRTFLPALAKRLGKAGTEGMDALRSGEEGRSSPKLQRQAAVKRS